MNQIPQELSGNIRTKRISKDTKVDMTPMVDLGFLLITFFIFNTVLSKNQVVHLVMPKDGDATIIPESKALTIFPEGKDLVYWYEGMSDERNLVHQTHLSNETGGLRDLIEKKQQRLVAEFGTSSGLTVIIKPGSNCSYGEVMATLDEMAINEVKKYAVIGQDENDKIMIAKSFH